MLMSAKMERMIVKAKYYRRSTIIEFLRTELHQLRREERVTARILRELEWEEQLEKLQTEVDEENRT